MPAFSAATPLLVPEDKLTKCTGFSQSVTSVSHLVSPAAGAFFYAAWSPDKIVVIDIAGAVMACISVAMVSFPKYKADEAAPAGHFLKELKDAYVVLRENKGLFSLLWVGMLYMFVFMPINALFPLMSMQYFNGTPAHAAVAEIVFAAGMLVGGLILGAWGGFKKRPLTIALSIMLMGIGLVISGILPQNSFVFFAVCCAIMGLSAPFYGVQTALYQEKIKQEYLGRVFSLSISTMSLAMPLGLLFAGAFAEQIGVHRWFLISGIGIMVISVITLLLPSVRAIDKDRK
jgi:DHA3 family macrolide efflux protein-like MFS transporter